MRLKCVLFFFFFVLTCPSAHAQKTPSITLAVEFVDHAACVHIAQHFGWYKAAGLDIRAMDSYATGMALAAALCRGGIDAAYICLFPAIHAHANGNAPIKVVSGTHLYGYGLIVDPMKVRSIQDLCKPDVRLGCTRDGSPPAVLLNKVIGQYNLDSSLMARTRRMPPPKLLLALGTGQLDAVFAPEQYPTMGRMSGFHELLQAKDVWPRMQGSVLVVRQELLDKHPWVVERLVAVTGRGIAYIRKNPVKAAGIVARALDVAGRDITPMKLKEDMRRLSVTPEAVYRSLTTKMEHTQHIDPEVVQDMIDYAAKLNDIKASFSARDILDLRYLKTNADHDG